MKRAATDPLPMAIRMMAKAVYASRAGRTNGHRHFSALWTSSRGYRASVSEAGDEEVAVPDLVGLAVGYARERGHDAAVIVVSADVDGPPLGALTWPGVWIVNAQEPLAGARVRKWDNVRVTYNRADGNEAGGREPRLPSPNPDGLEAHATVDERQLLLATFQ